LEQALSTLSLRSHGADPGSFCRLAHKLVFFKAEQNQARLRQHLLYDSRHLKSIHLGQGEAENHQIGFQLLREDLIAERIAIESYSEIIRYLGDNDPTSRRLMEDILANEEEHAEDMKTLLESIGEDEKKDEKKTGRKAS
jgi:ferritin-like protein